MSVDKKTFLKSVTVLYDTREQKNEHILNALSQLGIMTQARKLDFGDYSFMAQDRDFSMSCAIERKADVDEIYGNVMHDRGRIEKELAAACKLSVGFTVLLEGIGSWAELKTYEVPDYKMQMSPERKVKNTGAFVYSTLKSWSCANRYGFTVEFVPDKADTAAKMLEIFYYYWRNYKEQTAARG